MSAERFEAYRPGTPIKVADSFTACLEGVVADAERSPLTPFYFVRDAETGAVYVQTPWGAREALAAEALPDPRD